ncbi:LAME_0C03950g1_1 [Lachancea meyersii CBS 8951]|uniref:LAME_0C03950g1_1 n=1 Tax=Lachancea meyersii CBS 8951 TaxID=1266667 RepID=A0A1G4J0J1_9SACH|nr:LAME_0C03950g1_1 [Lachancea meyersii CBS 8951]
MNSVSRWIALTYSTLVLTATLVRAETHVFNWTTGWGTYNVDGTKERPVITCNGEWPWPDVTVNKGDRVEVYLNNGFDDRNTSLHFHGLFQNGTNQMDGPNMVVQCPIGPGDTFLYNFTVEDNVGTYWYHSHTAGQYQDGMRGTFVVQDKDDFPYDYDEDVVLQLGEWYHDVTDVLHHQFLSVYNPTGAEPIPQNLIMNNTRNNTWHVQPDTTYLLRLVNTGGFVSQYFWIEDHEMEVVEVDGVYTDRNTTNMIYITTAQRYSVLVHTKNSTDRNYAVMQKFDDTMLDKLPADLQLNTTNYMVYNADAELPDEDVVDELDFLDDFYLVPYNKVEALGDPDYRITVNVSMDNLINGINYAFFNNLTYVVPKVPTLMTALSAGEDAVNAEVYGSNTHSYVLGKDEIVEIVLNNLDSGTHPFHLHGHVFQTMVRDVAYDADTDVPHPYQEDDHPAFPEYPMLRDTIYVRPQSNFVIRFKADNPGVWFFHCHIEWHLTQGLAFVLIEDPQGIQERSSQQLTESSINACKSLGVPFEGNAAGNTDDYMNLKGENVQEKFIPSGFTAKGIVAMTFSCLAAVLGLVAIAVYGLMDLSNIEEKVINELDLDVDQVVAADSNTEDNESEPKRRINSD